MVHRVVCRVLCDVIARGHVPGAAPNTRLFGENARALGLTDLRGVPDHRIIPPGRLLCAVDRVKFVELELLLGVERLVHRCVEASVDASVEVIAQAMLEVQVAKVTGWSVCARSWRSKSGVASPLVTRSRVTYVLDQGRVEVGANLGATRYFTCFFVGARAWVVEIVHFETFVACLPRCFRVAARMIVN